MYKKPSYYRPLFDIFAPVYDLGMWCAGLLFGGENVLRKITVDATNPCEGRRVLEICCGTATAALMARERGADVYGIDIAYGMLKVAREKAQRKNVKISLINGDTISIPFKEGVFDRVIASIGLHEMPFEGTRNILREVKRVLKNNGRLIIFDYHKGEGLAGLLQKIFFVFTEHAAAREFINADLQKELREAGFKNFQRRILAKGVLQVITVTT